MPPGARRVAVIGDELSSSLWPAKPGANRVPLNVCYENITGNQTESDWVRTAVRDSWDANSWVDFTWGVACQAGEPIVLGSIPRP